MKSLAITFILLITILSFCHAGGDSFETEIVSLVSKGNSEYKIELIQHTLPYASEEISPRRLIIHLRFEPSAFGTPLPSYASESQYLEAILSLKEKEKEGGKFPFGIMADGYAPIEGKKNEFQSNTLAILLEHSGRKVIYSFAKRI